MSLTERIKNRIKKLPDATAFRYSDLMIEKSEYLSAAKVLERMIAAAEIKRLSKGVFYKPQKSVFGDIGPGYEQMLKKYLYQNGKRIAYITGEYLYNLLELTTQVAFRIKLATRGSRVNINTKQLKVTTVKAYADITEKNYELLGYLDVLNNIDTIPDCGTGKALNLMLKKIEKLEIKQQQELIRLALKYPPRVRALTGAVFESLKTELNIEALKESLNPLTSYKLGLQKGELPTAQNWRIK